MKDDTISSLMGVSFKLVQRFFFITFWFDFPKAFHFGAENISPFNPEYYSKNIQKLKIGVLILQMMNYQLNSQELLLQNQWSKNEKLHFKDTT